MTESEEKAYRKGLIDGCEALSKIMALFQKGTYEEIMSFLESMKDSANDNDDML